MPAPISVQLLIYYRSTMPPCRFKISSSSSATRQIQIRKRAFLPYFFSKRSVAEGRAEQRIYFWRGTILPPIFCPLLKKIDTQVSNPLVHESTTVFFALPQNLCPLLIGKHLYKGNF